MASGRPGEEDFGWLLNLKFSSKKKSPFSSSFFFVAAYQEYPQVNFWQFKVLSKLF